MFLAHEKALFSFLLRVNSSSTINTSTINTSKYAASEIFDGQQFVSFRMVCTYGSALIVFVVTLTIHCQYYYSSKYIVAIYDVRSSQPHR